jgi:hypothetical protein
MTFYDVNKMEYKDYEKRVKDYKPYRGTTNAYPVGARRYSARHFVMRDDGVVEVYYAGLPYKKERQERGEPLAPLLYIHPDNTVEFNRSSDVGFLTKLTGYSVRHDMKYGGTIICNFGLRGSIHPVFKGARYSLDTFTCLTPYEWHHPKVNRKKAKESIKKYDEFLKLHKVFIDPMSVEGFNGMFEDFDKEIGEQWENQHAWSINIFDKMVESKRYADAAVYLNVVDRGFWWIKYAVDRDIDNFKSFVCKFAHSGLKKVVYKYGGEHVFDYREIPAGGHITSSKWRVLVTSNGQPVERL